MLDILEIAGIVIGVLIIIASPIFALIILYDNKKNKKHIKYYIINHTGNVFKEYDDEITRDNDLECYTNMGFKFKACNKIHTN
jgi:hypothetical protein